MIRFICLDCKGVRHEKCRGGTWCDCQHRKPKEEHHAV